MVTRRPQRAEGPVEAPRHDRVHRADRGTRRGPRHFEAVPANHGIPGAQDLAALLDFVDRDIEVLLRVAEKDLLIGGVPPLDRLDLLEELLALQLRQIAS